MTLALCLFALVGANVGTNMRAAVEVDSLGSLIKNLPRRFEVAKPITASFGEHQETAQVAQPNSTTMAFYNKLRFSCVRLQATVTEQNILQPWGKEKGKAVFVGSGFVVRNIETGPLVVTNAHVVNDAADLVIQVPSAGQGMYKARPLLVNHDMDIALVSLVSEDEYKLFKADVGRDLDPVKLLAEPPKLGAEVVAMGYPLGVTSVKISRGVLSGNEQVSEYMAYQQSAPISPGNSGGPLFLDGTETVVGINFAAAVAEGAQAQNYAIPAFRVQQMLTLLDQKGGYYDVEKCKADRSKCSLKLPGIQAAAVPGGEEVYERYGCDKGIQITRALKDSIFTNADPPVAPKTFITSINGIDIDSYGEAPAAEYFENNVPFSEHMFMEPKLQSVEVGTCTCGKEGKAKVPLQFGGKFQDHAKVPHYDETNLETYDYELFAGVTVQQLSVNLIQELAGPEHGRMDLVKYMVDPDQSARLVVTAVDGLSHAAKVFQVGDVVKRLNGEKVHTLEDFRAHFSPKDASCGSSGSKSWLLESHGGRELVVDFHKELDAAKKAHAKGRPLSTATYDALKDAKIQPETLAEGAAAGETFRTPEEELIVDVRPVEERTDVRRGGKRWDPFARFRL